MKTAVRQTPRTPAVLASAAVTGRTTPTSPALREEAGRRGQRQREWPRARVPQLLGTHGCPPKKSPRSQGCAHLITLEIVGTRLARSVAARRPPATVGASACSMRWIATVSRRSTARNPDARAVPLSVIRTPLITHRSASRSPVNRDNASAECRQDTADAWTHAVQAHKRHRPCSSCASERSCDYKLRNPG